MKIALEIPESEKEKLIVALRDGDSELKKLLSPPTSSLVRDLHDGKSCWPKQRNPQQTIENICCGLHLVTRKLAKRYANRAGLTINDEYDVQDLVGALLAVEFTDIRCEEWSPSYAGGASRFDFLLKPEKTVLEIKMTRDGLGAKDLGEQLVIDIARYRAHPDCKTLICFAYDPTGRIPNPCGIENDLNGLHGEVSVRVIISPKGV